MSKSFGEGFNRPMPSAVNKYHLGMSLKDAQVSFSEILTRPSTAVTSIFFNQGYHSSGGSSVGAFVAYDAANDYLYNMGSTGSYLLTQSHTASGGSYVKDLATLSSWLRGLACDAAGNVYFTDGSWLYGYNSAGNQLYKVSLGASYNNLFYDQYSGYLYLSSSSGTVTKRFLASTGAVDSGFTCSKYASGAFNMQASSNYLYLSDSTALYQINKATGTVISTATIAGLNYLSIDQKLGIIYSVSNTNNTVYAFCESALQQIAALTNTAFASTVGVQVDPIGNVILATSGASPFYKILSKLDSICWNTTSSSGSSGPWIFLDKNHALYSGNMNGYGEMCINDLYAKLIG